MSMPAEAANEREFVRSTVERLRDARVVFVHAPKMWDACILPVPLQWTSVEFTAENRDHIPSDKSGVYAFMLEPTFLGPPRSAYLLYIGKADRRRFRRRYRDYIYERDQGFARPPISWMLEKWEGHIRFHYAPVDDVSLIPQVEEALLNACIPPYNERFTGSIGKAIRAFRRTGG